MAEITGASVEATNQGTVGTHVVDVEKKTATTHEINKATTSSKLAKLKLISFKSVIAIDKGEWGWINNAAICHTISSK